MKHTRDVRISILLLLALLSTACGPFGDGSTAEQDTKTVDVAFGDQDNFAKDDDEPIEEVPAEPPSEPAEPPATSEPDPAETEPAPQPTLTEFSDEIRRRSIPGAREVTIEQIYLVEQFWHEAAVVIGHEYEPLDNARLFTRSELEQGPRQDCGFDGDLETLDPDDVEFNAFVAPCDEGVTVVWDDIDLGEDLEARFPGAGIAMLMAHEWGHVIQFQREQWEQNSILAEQQADCYSGAYAKWAQDRQLWPFVSPQALDFAIISTLEARDEIGVRPEDFDAHGNGFDRVRATQDGYDRGVEFCANYDSVSPPLTQMGFTSERDRANEGNLPYQPAFDLLIPAITDWYESLVDEPLEPSVDLPSETLLRELHASVGDASMLAEYGLRYGFAVQEVLGEETTGEGAALQRACLVGAYLNDALTNGIGDDGTGTGTAAGSLSPGDLDEVIITLASSDELLANPGLVFEMVASMRVGTLQGLPSCSLS